MILKFIRVDIIIIIIIIIRVGIVIINSFSLLYSSSLYKHVTTNSSLLLSMDIGLFLIFTLTAC